MRYRFEVPGPPVPWQRAGRNKQTGATYTKPETREYQRKVKFYAVAAGVRRIEGAVSLGLYFYVKDERARDGDNLQKTIQDALKSIGYADDKQIRQWFGSVDVDRERPRAVIVLEPRNPVSL